MIPEGSSGCAIVPKVMCWSFLSESSRMVYSTSPSANRMSPVIDITQNLQREMRSQMISSVLLFRSAKKISLILG